MIALTDAQRNELFRRDSREWRKRGFQPKRTVKDVERVERRKRYRQHTGAHCGAFLIETSGENFYA